MIKPVTSTSVATNGADEVAGSNPRRRNRNGSSTAWLRWIETAAWLSGSAVAEPIFTEGYHGTRGDRRAAFMTGYNSGLVAQCVTGDAVFKNNVKGTQELETTSDATKALTKPSTRTPPTNVAVNQNSSALMTRIESPIVMSWIGQVSKVMIGLMSEFTTAR